MIEVPAEGEGTASARIMQALDEVERLREAGALTDGAVIALQAGVYELSGWTPYCEGIMQCDLAADGLAGRTFNQLFYRGERQTPARYPNHGHASGGTLYAITPDGSKQWDYFTGNASSSPAIGGTSVLHRGGGLNHSRLLLVTSEPLPSPF